MICLITSILILSSFPIANSEIIRYKTITITAGGSLDPYQNVPIQRSGNIYTFAGDLYGCIIIEKDGITINGNGYTIQGEGNFSGIDIQAKSNILIKNLSINNHYHGILLSAKRITPNLNEYPYEKCEKITISDNNITNNNNGIKSDWAVDTIFDGNFIQNNNVGLAINNAIDSILRDNELWDNNIHVSANPSTIIEDSNTVDGIRLAPTVTPTPSPSPEPEPFPTTIVIASVGVATIVGLGILAYFKKRRT
jgi:hypothetical protein